MNTISSHKNIAVLIILLFCSQSFSQTKGTISGFIRDSKSGEKILYSNILLYSASTDSISEPIMGTTTNDYGYFIFINLPLGNYKLIVRNIGYRPNTQKVTITEKNDAVKLSIELNQEDVKLEDVVVEDKSEEIVSLGTIQIKPAALQNLPTMSGEIDLLKSLQLMPGIQAGSEISGGLYVRGGSPDQTLTVIDGVMVYNPAHLGNFASTFNSNAIQNIKLYKSTFPAEYGGRLSSVLDIKLRSGTKEKTTGSLGLGAISSNATIEGPFTDKSTYILSGRYMYFDLLQKSVSKSAMVPKYHFYDFNMKVTYNFADDNILSISALTNNDKLYSDQKGADLLYNIYWTNTTASLNWYKVSASSLIFNNKLSVVNYKFHTLLEDNTDNSDATDYFAQSDLTDLYLKEDVEYHWANNHKLKTGLELTYHIYNLKFSQVYIQNLEINSNFGENFNSLESAFYLQNESTLFSSLNSNVGVRVFFFKDRKFVGIEPRASLAYRVTDDLSLMGGYTKAHQFLHLIVKNGFSLPSDLWYPANKNINLSSSEQFVLGFEQLFFGGVYSFSAEAYYRDMKHLYEFGDRQEVDFEKPISERLTEGEGEAYGLELMLHKRAGDINGWVGYTWSDTRRKFEELNAGYIFHPKYDRRHDVSVVLSYKINNDMDFGATWTYQTGRAFTSAEGKYIFYPVVGETDEPQVYFDYSKRNKYRLPAYHKLDLFFKYKFNFREYLVESYVSIYNAYNRKNVFANYVTYEQIKNDNTGKMETIPTLKQIVLFPFFPTVGVNIKF